MQCITFEDLLSSPDKKFLKIFAPSFTSRSSNQLASDNQKDLDLKAHKMSKIPMSGSKGPNTSRLAPPGSLSKRPREGSLDLETGLDAKKSKIDSLSVPSTNLTKSKSKSMMSIAGKPVAGVKPIASVTGRPSLAPGRTKSAAGVKNEPASRRQTTTALNDRTNTSRLTREKTTLNKTSASTTGGTKKIPSWDLKGRLELMEKMVHDSNNRLQTLEKEKENLQTDVEIKKEVVEQTSDELKNMRQNMAINEKELETMKNSLKEKEELFNTEKLQLKRQLEDETYTKNSLERKLKGLEDELTGKQTEIAGLKVSVAELSSSRAGVEAALSGTKAELEAARLQILALKNESEGKSAEIKACLVAKEEMMSKLRWEETERRKLHNMVQELKGNIRVFCRMRPLLGDEKVNGDDPKHVNFTSEKSMELSKNAEDGNKSIASGTKSTKYDFEFDRVFEPGTSQEVVYEEISQLVRSSMDGYNVCVFAYGQTGSGKTYTMEGGPGIEEFPEQCGVIPRTIRQIFEIKQQLVEKSWTYKLHASFLEIYNEEIRDLLQTDSNLKHEIKMSDSKGTDVHVTNLKVEEVSNEGQIERIIEKARKNRAWAKTLANERSSRSHSVFILKITGHNSATSESCCGTLNLVDLAGSERVKDSGSEGQRLVEAQNINKSLSNLGNVIMALAQKNAHVPYRNSKLTHLLQPSLGGNSKTLMFVNISPKEEHINETLNSLRFATKVNSCNIGTASAKKNVK